MGTRLTHEELDILNSVLKYINPRDKFFSIESLHAINILQPLYPREEGIGLKKYDQVRRAYTERKVYAHISDWLIEQSFATKTPKNSSVFIDLKLTNSGEVLWAYGDCLTYFGSFENIDSDAVSNRISYVISNAPAFGEFSIVVIEPKVQFVQMNIFSGDDEGELKKIQDIISGKDGLIKKHEQSLVDERALQWLVDNGFAVNRHDILQDGKFYRQLTDKGRELKERGSIADYNAYVSECVKKEERQKVRDENLYWIQFWIAVGAVSAAAYYVLEIVLEITKRRFSVPDINLFVCLCVFAFGIFAGMIIYQIIKHLLEKKG